RPRAHPRCRARPGDHRLRGRPGDHDAVHRPRAAGGGGARPPGLPVDGAEHAVRRRAVRSLPARSVPRLPGRPRVPLRGPGPVADDQGAVMTVPASEPAKPTLAVWKFSSCDGCQLTLLNCEAELLALAGSVRIANFPEA